MNLSNERLGGSLLAEHPGCCGRQLLYPLVFGLVVLATGIGSMVLCLTRTPPFPCAPAFLSCLLTPLHVRVLFFSALSRHLLSVRRHPGPSGHVSVHGERVLALPITDPACRAQPVLLTRVHRLHHPLAYHCYCPNDIRPRSSHPQCQ